MSVNKSAGKARSHFKRWLRWRSKQLEAEVNLKFSTPHDAKWRQAFQIAETSKQKTRVLTGDLRLWPALRNPLGNQDQVKLGKTPLTR